MKKEAKYIDFEYKKEKASLRCLKSWKRSEEKKKEISQVVKKELSLSLTNT